MIVYYGNYFVFLQTKNKRRTMLRNMLPYKIKMSKKLKVMVIVLAVIITLIVIKVVWVTCATSGLGDWESERKDIIRRANYLTERVATSPRQLLNEMPSGIGEQFQGGIIYLLNDMAVPSVGLGKTTIHYPMLP